jgi:diguanylate cyclase (GGDEF)-like protein/PAS domain S-box-containing protein
MPPASTDLAALLDQTLEVVWLWDADAARPVYVNRAFARVWGRPPEAFTAAADPVAFLRSTLHPDDRDRAGRNAAAPPADGSSAEYRVLRPNGEVRWVRARGRPYHCTGSPACRNLLIGIAEDVTERNRHVEQLESQRKALEEAYLHLQEVVVTDPLTGSKNRRGLEAALERAVDDARRHGTPVSAVALDIDNFKSYNDAFGHPAGDSVIVAVATVVQRTLRPTDLAARVGGEEFTVLLPDTDRAGAEAAAERIRRAIAHARWRHRPVTASLGCATWFPVRGDHPDSLLTDADKALYQSKRDGRNRVTHHSAMPEAEAPAPV